MAFVTLLYGDTGNKINSFLNGVTIVALGLRKQKVKHNIICMVTNDCLKYKDYLLTLFDKVIQVPYITGRKLKGSIKIADGITYDNKKSDIFTKINIFNKDLLNYDKIVYVDSDLVPIRDFDKLFDYDCPAGWLEVNEKGYIVWSQWNFGINTLIPDPYTNQTHRISNSINGGLLVIKPDKNIYNRFINTLTNYNLYKLKHKGGFDGRGYFSDKYFNYDQQFITQEFTGSWNYIDGLYNFWGYTGYDIKGVHMAGLRYKVNNKIIYAKTWEYQRNEKSSYTYFTNVTLIYGLKNYKHIKDYILKDLTFIINNKFYKVSEITTKLLSKLTEMQQQLLKLINHKQYNNVDCQIQII